MQRSECELPADVGKNEMSTTLDTSTSLEFAMMSNCIFKHVLMTMCLACSAHTLADVPAPEASGPVTAIWHVQRVAFNYRSGEIYYSCDSLRDKIASILKAVGARDNIDVDCAAAAGNLTNSATTMITVSSPIEATQANVTAATSYSPETELVARLNNTQLPTANDIERFSAEWQIIKLNRTRGLQLDAGDCDLLRGLVKQVFPHMAVRLVKQGFSCPHSGLSRVRPKMHVAAMMPSPVVPLAFAPESK